MLRELRATASAAGRHPHCARRVRDTVAGLEHGADDYVTKPFPFEELLARVRVRLRTSARRGDRCCEAGDARLDLRTRAPASTDETVDLSAREFSLLEVFIRQPARC